MNVELSMERTTRIAAALGVIGVVTAFMIRGPRDAAGFLIGAAISVATVRSWFRLAETIGTNGKRPAVGSAAFLVLRYVLIAGAIYATIHVLGSAPAVLIVGFLVSFAAVLADLLFGQMVSK